MVAHPGPGFTLSLVIGIVLGLAAVMSVVVYLLPDPDSVPRCRVGDNRVHPPTAFGPTRSVLAAMAYPANIRGAGIGVAEFGGRLGAAAGGVAGGTLTGAGMGLSGLFLILLLPIGVLLGSLTGLRMQSRRPGAGARGSRLSWPRDCGRDPGTSGRRGLSTPITGLEPRRLLPPVEVGSTSTGGRTCIWPAPYGGHRPGNAPRTILRRTVQRRPGPEPTAGGQA